MNDDDLIQEQIEYYRQRAPEYDETSTPAGDPLAAYALEIQDAIRHFAPRGNVLEIASGTGSGTRHLIEQATNVTALDSSPEVHELSRQKLQDNDKVRYVVADIFSWKPTDKYDVVFFSYWLSHVPPTMFDAFWEAVGNALKSDGRVFFIDELEDAWRKEEHLREDFVHDPSVPIVRRPLLDGRSFNVVKVFWDPDELEQRLADLGWAIKVHAVGPFYWAEGQLRTAP